MSRHSDPRKATAWERRAIGLPIFSRSSAVRYAVIPTSSSM